MNAERRSLVVTVEILRVLADCQGYLLPEDSLLNQCRLTVRPVILEQEFAEALRHLEASHCVTGIRPALGGPVKWKITDQGKSALAEA